MKIIIVTTEDEGMKKTGFGGNEACTVLKKALKKTFNDVRISVCGRENDLDIVIRNRPDIIILAAEYIQVSRGRRVLLSEYFEENKINFTGSEKRSIELGTNKVRAKKMLLRRGIPTAAFCEVNKDDFPSEKDINMTYPIFLKPLDEANGNGVDDDSIVHNYASLQSKSSKLFHKYGKTILAEKYLSGREFTVAILEDIANQSYIVSPIEIVAPKNKNGNRVLGEKVKQWNTEELICVKDEFLRHSLVKMALRSFKGLGARDYARIDIRLDENNKCNFVEANLVPRLTGCSSYFPKAFEIDKGISYTEVARLVIKNAVDRTVEDKENIN